MQVNRETVASLLTIVVGVAVYHHSSVRLTPLGLAAICFNMFFAVLERLMQRHLMAQVAAPYFLTPLLGSKAWCMGKR